MTNLPYWHYDGIGLAELIKKKEVSVSEILEAVISRVEEINPSINAVINKMYDQSRKNSTTTGAFAGVPILLKDITQEIKGEPITSGSKAYKNYRAEEDSEFVKSINLKNKTKSMFLMTNLASIYNHKRLEN